MSAFKCEVVRVKIVPRPNADKIEIAMIGDFQSIVKKGHILKRLRCGNTALSDKVQIREGVVVKSTTEARHPSYGRKIAKSVSEAYLLRSGNTSEFN
jgi:hypothetical protein